MKKHYISPEELSDGMKNAKKRLWLLVLVFFLAVASTFLILLIKPFKIYVLIFDVSASMSGTMDGVEGRTKIDAAKESIIKFIENSRGNDYFVVATYGPGNCGGKGLQWLQDNPGKCGGSILVDISNDKLQLCDEISNIQAKDADTHFSECLYKVFKNLEKNLPNSPGFKRIEVLIIGDGEEHCKAIEPGNNVVLLPWTFYKKLRVNTIAVQVVNENLSNLQTLAADGNGEFVDVSDADDFYKKLNEIFHRGPIWLLLVYIAIAILLFLLFLLILRVR